MVQDKEKITLREFIELKFDLLDTALKLQAKEYERRLEELNHEAARLKSSQSISVSREFFDAKHEDIQKQVDELKLSRAILQGKADQKSVIIVGLLGGISVLISLITLLLTFFK